MARKKASELVAVVEQAAAVAVEQAAPKVKKAGKAAAEAAVDAATFVFEVTKAATCKMTTPIYGPACPKCGEPTVIKVNRKTHQPFAACSSWDATGCGFTSRLTFSDEQ